MRPALVEVLARVLEERPRQGPWAETDRPPAIGEESDEESSAWRFRELFVPWPRLRSGSPGEFHAIRPLTTHSLRLMKDGECVVSGLFLETLVGQRAGPGALHLGEQSLG